MEPFQLDPPRAPLAPVVASVPHSGTFVPPEVLRRLDPAYRHLPDTDWHVDRLFSFLPDLGVALLHDTHSRYVADLNRPLSEPLYGPFTRSVVAAETFEGEPLYLEPPTASEVQERVERVYRPYHHALQALLDERVERFGRAFLLDLHSFDTVIPQDVDLGDDDGRLEAHALMPALRNALGERFDVVENEAWSGGYISRYYGRQERIEAVQVEVNHAAYLHPEELGGITPPSWDHARFHDARRRFEEAFRLVVEQLAQP